MYTKFHVERKDFKFCTENALFENKHLAQDQKFLIQMSLGCNLEKNYFCFLKQHTPIFQNAIFQVKQKNFKLAFFSFS